MARLQHSDVGAECARAVEKRTLQRGGVVGRSRHAVGRFPKRQGWSGTASNYRDTRRWSGDVGYSRSTDESINDSAVNLQDRDCTVPIAFGSASQLFGQVAK